MSEHEIKDSGHLRTFSTGAVRDRAAGKGRPDLISPIALRRLGMWMEKGAEKYGARNWEQGIPLSEYLASAYRHLLALMAGEDDEDHAAALMFNAQGFIHTREMVDRGVLPCELDDIGWGRYEEREDANCKCGHALFERESKRTGKCHVCRGLDLSGRPVLDRLVEAAEDESEVGDE